MSGLDPKRLVKIKSVVQLPDGTQKYLHGTGYFVTDDLILTASHVLAKDTTTEISFFVEANPSKWREAELQPAWRDTELDAVLLKVDPPLVDVAPLELLKDLPVTDEEWKSSGYPKAAVEGNDWKTAQLDGKINALGGGGQGQRFLELTVNNPPTGEGWRGISGAPVFIGDKLAGIIKSFPSGFPGSRLDAVPIAHLSRAKGFLSTIAPQWLEPFPDKPWCLALVSETRKNKADNFQLLITSAIKRKITEPGLMDISEEPKMVNITEVLENRARWLQFIRAVCAAPIMVIDVTGFEPAVMLMLGIRAVVRRGVTITTTSAKFDLSNLAALPFNIQEAKLISLAAPSKNKNNPQPHPVNSLGQAILDGLNQLKSHPGYLDLPAYDAVRSPEPKAKAREEAKVSGEAKGKSQGSGQGSTDGSQSTTAVATVQETVLMLCPFHPGYEENRFCLSDGILTVAIKDVVRMLDILSPRLVGQALYEHIRWSRFCIVDWTYWRPNVFFELGVRLACSSIGPVCFIEDETTYDQARVDSAPANPQASANSLPPGKGSAQLKQKEQLISLLDPIKYKCAHSDDSDDPDDSDDSDDSYEPFRKAWERFQSYSQKGTAPPPFSMLEHDETYRTIAAGEYDWAQETIIKAPHEELLETVEIQIGKDPQTTGKFTALFASPSHLEFSRALERNAAERGIAAWYYFLYRHSGEKLNSDSEARKQAIAFGLKIGQWIPPWKEYEDIKKVISDKVDELMDMELDSKMKQGD